MSVRDKCFLTLHENVKSSVVFAPSDYFAGKNIGEIAAYKNGDVAEHMGHVSVTFSYLLSDNRNRRTSVSENSSTWNELLYLNPNFEITCCDGKH